MLCNELDVVIVAYTLKHLYIGYTISWMCFCGTLSQKFEMFICYTMYINYHTYICVSRQLYMNYDLCKKELNRNIQIDVVPTL